MTDLERVDQIEAIRVRNNRSWMQLLRVALEADPGKTKAILRQIEENDSAITRLLKEIGES